MDIAKMVGQLRAELENLDVAIASLERLQHGGRPGKAPHFIQEVKLGTSARGRKRKPKTAAAEGGQQ